MKLACKVVNEAKHFNTKVRQLEGLGSRQIRLALKESSRMIENMLNPNNDAPNPKSEVDRVALLESTKLLEQAIVRLKSVKETRRKKK